MGLIRPGGLALLALAGVVLALHMLRVERTEHRVPSTWLWRRLELDPPASRPWRRPPPSWLLALQLAAVTLLVAAFARPYMMSDAVVGDALIILLDHSASMAATDVEPDRLGAAKRAVQARAEEALSAGARVTIVAFADTTDVVLSGSSDPAEVRRALDAVEPRPVRGRLADALGLAGALAEGMAGARIVLASDGALDSDGVLPPAAPLEWLPFGVGDDNQSIVALSLDRQADGSEEAFVRVANHGRSSARRRVVLESAGQLIDARDLDLPPGGGAAFVVPVEAPLDSDFGAAGSAGDATALGADQAGVLTARLIGDDLLAMDDVAFAVSPRGEGARVGLVSAGNRFLETALSLLPGVASLSTRASDDDTPLGRTDVIVVDGVIPPTGTAPLLLVNPPDGSPGIAIAGWLEAPRPIVAAPEHPLAVPGIEETAILDAAALELGPEWLPIIVTEVDGRAWPLVAEGVADGRRTIVVAFDLRRSDLPLLPAFPLFVASVLDRLAPATALGVPAAAAPGVPLPLRLPPRAIAAEITGPGGETRPLDPSAGELLWVPEDIGIHRLSVSFGEDEPPLNVPLAVSAAIGEGSDIRARPIAAADVDADTDETGDGQRGRRELWWALVWVALALSGAEWALDHRAGWPGSATPRAILRRYRRPPR